MISLAVESEDVGVMGSLKCESVLMAMAAVDIKYVECGQ